MNLYVIAGPPEEGLARALEDFERQFSYPLGPGRSFRIEHGADYARFYRSIGEARCLAAERDGRVLGVISAALRPLVWPDGSERLVCYLGDLKVAPDLRGSRIILRFLEALANWARPRAAEAFGVVMDGTRSLPSAYSGRVGIPTFSAVGKMIIFRFPCGRSDRSAGSPATYAPCSPIVVRALYRELSKGRFATPVGDPAERSLMKPVWFVSPDASACGCLEDTRRGKRLVADDGVEMISAHLSSFAFRTPEAGAAVVRTALARAADMGYPALFVTVAEPDAMALHAALDNMEAVLAPATVFGFGFEPGVWNIHSSEI